VNRLGERASFAVRRPDILWRKIRRQDFITIQLSEISPYLDDAPVILEAGACNGDDTVSFARHWPAARIHAFEPVPDLMTEVERRTSHLPQVRRYPLALADRTGTAVFHVSRDRDDGTQTRRNRGSSSLLVPAGPVLANSQMVFDRAITVQTTTIPDWARAENVGRVDFMWLDLQGMELATLRAAGPLLAATTALCLEVLRKEFYLNCPTYDEVMPWMRDQGFTPVIDRVGLWFGNVLFVRDQKARRY
jgi:FkbM family methyltransferase